MNKASNFNEGSVSGRDNIRASIRFKKKNSHKILKDSSSLKTEASIFTSTAPELSNRSNKTSWGFFQHEINNSLTGAVLSVAHRSYSSSEAICCHKLDASSHLVQRVVKSVLISTLQKILSGRSPMYKRKSVGPRMQVQH